jgi:uncharacterized protein (TIGR03435 family)
MKSDERDLQELVDRSIPTPSAREMESRCDRVLQKLQSGNLATSEVTTLQPEPIRSRQTPWRVAVVSAAIAAALVVALSPTIWKTVDVKDVTAVTAVKPVPSSAKGDSSTTTSTTTTLADGSRIEMRAGAEAVVENAPDGLLIRLNAGSMMVFAAKQAAGRHLYVQTRDLKVSVVGTVFFVNADDNGTRVAVVEGEVRVQQGTVETSLRPGEQLASNPKSENLKFFLETGWSREAFAYLSKLHESIAQSLAARQSSGRTTSVSDKPKFEEASIRLCEQDYQAPEGARGGGNNSIRVSPGRLDAVCMTVATLIRTAHRPLENNSAFPGDVHTLRMDSTYGLGTEDGTRVRGGPSWVRSERYMIAAVGNSTDAWTLQGPMLLDLLERRFQLKLRVETEESSVYALRIAKDGLKIAPGEPQSCTRVSQGTPEGPSLVSQEERRRRLEAIRQSELPQCGMSTHDSGPNVVTIAGLGPIRLLVDRLSGMSRHPGPLYDTLNGLLVVDKTGIPDTHLFTYLLEHAVDENFYARILPPDISVADYLGPDIRKPKAPNVFDAVEKLGLHLEKSKAPREFIVIEHIERPSDN